MKKYNLFEEIGKAENAIDRANFLVNDMHKFTRREAQTVMATLNKVQYLSERIMAVTFKKQAKVRFVSDGKRIRLVG